MEIAEILTEQDLCGVAVIHQESVDFARENMLSDEKIANLSLFFKAVCDETRIKILHCLSLGRLCVCDLAALQNVTASAVSHQLRVLKQAGLVKSCRQGKVVYYQLADEHVNIILACALEHVSER